MKKKWIQLVVVLVLFVGAVGAFIWLQKDAEQTDTESSSQAEPTILVAGKEPAAKVRSIKIENETGTYTIVNQAPDKTEDGLDAKKEYTIQDTKDLPLNQPLLSAAGNAVVALRAKSVIGKGNFSTYGLDTPRATVTVKYDDDQTVILIGSEAPGGEGVYVSNDKDDTVYLVQSSNLSHFLKGKLEYVDTSITKGSSENNTFTKFTLSGSAFEEPIVVEATPEDAQDVSGITLNSHAIVSPIHRGVDGQNGMTILHSVFGLQAEAVVAEKQDESTLEQFGLTEPYAVAEVKTEDEEIGSFTLSVSQPDAEGKVYAIRSGSPVIYRLSASSVPWSTAKLFDLMDHMAITPFINNVASVTVDVSDRSYTFKLTGEGDDIKVDLDGKEINPDYFRQFYQTMLFARFQEETEETPSGEPILRYTYRYKDANQKPEVVAFYTGPARKAFIVLNDGTPYFTQSIYVDRVLEDIVKLVNGEEVRSYI